MKLINLIVIGDYKIPKDAELIPPDFQTDVDNLINSLIGGMGEKFLPLTGSLGGSETETFNQPILSQYNGHTSTDIQEFLGLFKEIQTHALTKIRKNLNQSQNLHLRSHCY